MLILVGSGGHRVRVRAPADRRPDVERLGFGIAVVGFSAVANLVVSAGRRRTARGPSPRRWRATRRTCAPTPSRRSACSPASCSCRSPARSGSTRWSRCSSRARSCGGLRILTRSSRVLVDEALPAEEHDAIREAEVAGVRGPRRRRLPQAAHAPRRRAPLRRPARAVRAGTSLEQAHETAHALQDAIARTAARRHRRADPPRARGPVAAGHRAAAGAGQRRLIAAEQATAKTTPA